MSKKNKKNKRNKKTKSNKYIYVENLFNMMWCHDEYYRDNYIDEIDYIIDSEPDQDMYEYRDGNLFASVEGAMHIIEKSDLNPDKYINTIKFIGKENKGLDGLKLKTNLKIKVNGDDINECKLGKEYIENVVLGICTNGKTIDEIDTSKLRKLDVKTINAVNKTYETSVKSGHKLHSINLAKCMDYVNDNDPEIVRRMLYYYSFNPIEMNDYKTKYDYSGHDEIKKMISKEFKYIRKRNKKKNKSL